MKTQNFTIATNVSLNEDTTFAAINTDDAIRVTVQGTYSGNANAFMGFQVSNDTGDQQVGNLPVTWNDTGDGETLSGSGSFFYTVVPFCAEWFSCYTIATFTGVQTLSVVADTGRKQVQRVVTTDDVSGSLNNTYFYISSLNLISKAENDFYVWFNNGSGVDPNVPSKTGLQIVYSNDATAATLAGLINSAFNALTNDFTSSITGGTNVNVSCKACGVLPHITDGAVPTGFLFSNITTGVNSNLLNKYFKLYSPEVVHSYYIWANVDAIGTDPGPIAGLTSVAIAITSGSTATTVGGLYATGITVLNASGDFSAVNASGNVTITNGRSGAFTPALNINTPFTIADSTPQGTLDSLTIKIDLG